MNDSTRANRTVLLLIGGLPVTMILLATWLWYYVASGELDIVGLLGTADCEFRCCCCCCCLETRFSCIALSSLLPVTVNLMCTALSSLLLVTANLMCTQLLVTCNRILGTKVCKQQV